MNQPPKRPEPDYSRDAIYTQEQLDDYAEAYGNWCARVALETFHREVPND